MVGGVISWMWILLGAVDSGAEENVCPVDRGNRFRVNERVPEIRLRGANGSAIKHHGERCVLVTTEGFGGREKYTLITP